MRLFERIQQRIAERRRFYIGKPMMEGANGQHVTLPYALGTEMALIDEIERLHNRLADLEARLPPPMTGATE